MKGVDSHRCRDQTSLPVASRNARNIQHNSYGYNVYVDASAS